MKKINFFFALAIYFFSNISLSSNEASKGQKEAYNKITEAVFAKNTIIEKIDKENLPILKREKVFEIKDKCSFITLFKKHYLPREFRLNQTAHSFILGNVRISKINQRPRKALKINAFKMCIFVIEINRESYLYIKTLSDDLPPVEEEPKTDMICTAIYSTDNQYPSIKTMFLPVMSQN